MRAYTIILLTFFVLSGSLAVAQTSNLVASGYAKLEARELNEAINFFSQALNQEPKDTAALSGIIRAHLLSNNLKDANKFIEIGIKEHPNHADFYFRRGLFNNLRGQYRRAITDFTKALELSKGTNEIQILINRGAAHIQDNSYNDALADFTEALEINPRNASALNYKAFVNYRLNNFREAINDYNKAIDLDPENALSYYNRGMSFLRTGDKAKACADFHQSCSRGNMNACRMIMAECSGRN